MANLQLYERFIKVKNSKQKMKLISAILGYIIFFVFWVFLGIYNLEKSIPIFIAGILSDILLIFLTSKYCFMEFEYSFLSSVLRIDRIIAKRKRKPIVKVDVKRFDDFFPYSDSEMDKRKFNKIYHAAHEEFSEENYVASFRDEGKGKCAIIFTPNEDLLNEMKLYFGNELRKNLFKNKQL